MIRIRRSTSDSLSRSVPLLRTKARNADGAAPSLAATEGGGLRDGTWGMSVRALRITVLKSAGNFTRDECHNLSADKIQRVKYFMFTRCGICCALAIFERRRGRLGSKISGCGQLAEVAVYFAMSGLPPEAGTKRKGRHVRWVPILLQKSKIERPGESR